MGAKHIELQDFLDDLIVESKHSKYTWLIGSGMSVSSGIPTAKEICVIIILHRYIIRHFKTPVWADNSGPLDYSKESLNAYLDWYEFEKQNNTDNLTKLVNDANVWIKSIAGFKDIDIDSPECYQRIFSNLFNEPHIPQLWITALVGRNKGVNLAHLCLAAILKDNKEFSDTVFTTNFDDLLLKAILSINHTARVFGDIGSNAPNPDSTYPKIVHLHGRHTEYNLINTNEQIQLTNLEMRNSFVSHLSSSSLIVLGYSGWDDLVMRTLIESKDKPDFIKGVLIWVPYQSSKTIIKETKHFLDTYYPNKVIIIENSEGSEEKGNLLDADYFMMSLLNKLNSDKTGFVDYRNALIENARIQHEFTLKQLKQYPEFDPEQRIKNHINKSREYILSNDHSNAMSECNLAIKLTEYEDLPKSLRANSLFHIGLLLLKLEKPMDSVEFLVKSEQLWSQIKDEGLIEEGNLGQAHAHRALGEAFRLVGDYDKVISHLKQAIKRYENNGEDAGKAYSLLLLGDTLLRIHKPSSSEAYFLEALKIFEITKNSYGAGIVYKCRGDSAKLKMNIGDAKTNYLSAINELEKVNDEITLGELYKNYGAILISDKEIASGLDYINKAKEIFATNNFLLGLANVHGCLGDYELYNNNNVQYAAEQYLKAFHLLQNTRYTYSLGNSIADIINCETNQIGTIPNIDHFVNFGRNICIDVRNEYLSNMLSNLK